MALADQQNAPASSSVIPLLTNWEEYIGQHPSGDLEGFARWLLFRSADAQPQHPAPSPQRQARGSISSGTASLAATIELEETARGTLLITRLSRLLGAKANPAMEKLGFTKEMEFGLLVQVSLMD